MREGGEVELGAKRDIGRREGAKVQGRDTGTGEGKVGLERLGELTVQCS